MGPHGIQGNSDANFVSCDEEIEVNKVCVKVDARDIRGCHNTVGDRPLGIVDMIKGVIRPIRRTEHR